MKKHLKELKLPAIVQGSTTKYTVTDAGGGRVNYVSDEGNCYPNHNEAADVLKWINDGTYTLLAAPLEDELVTALVVTADTTDCSTKLDRLQAKADKLEATLLRIQAMTANGYQ